MMETKKPKQFISPKTEEDYNDIYENEEWIKLNELIKYYKFYLDDLLRLPYYKRDLEIKHLIKFMRRAIKYFESLKKSDKK